MRKCRNAGYSSAQPLNNLNRMQHGSSGAVRDLLAAGGAGYNNQRMGVRALHDGEKALCADLLR